MASIYDRRYLLVNDPEVGTTYIPIRAKTISENIKTDFLQYGNIVDSSLSILKSKNAYSGQISTTFRPVESLYFFRSFFGTSVPDAGVESEEFVLTSSYNPINMKIESGDLEEIGVVNEYISILYSDVLINKIDFELKAKEYSNVSFSYIAKSISKLSEFEYNVEYSDEHPSIFYNITITLTPSVGSDIIYDDVMSCKIAMNNGGSNDSYHISSHEPSDLRKKQAQSCAVTFDFLGHSTDNFQLILDDLNSSLTYDVNISLYRIDGNIKSCEFNIYDCVITETKRDINRARDASKSLSVMGDLTNMDMTVNYNL